MKMIFFRLDAPKSRHLVGTTDLVTQGFNPGVAEGQQAESTGGTADFAQLPFRSLAGVSAVPMALSMRVVADPRVETPGYKIGHAYGALFSSQCLSRGVWAGGSEAPTGSGANGVVKKDR